MTLIPQRTSEYVKELLDYGKKKYGNGDIVGDKKPWHDNMSSLHRHLKAFERGEIFDGESGYHHLACVAVRAMQIFTKHLDSLEYFDEADRPSGSTTHDATVRTAQG